jgi:phosphate transport system substrate-binding protein
MQLFLKCHLKTVHAVLMACILLFISQLTLAQAQSLTGAGSTAAAPIYRSWSAQYQKQGGSALEYESIGSSAGLKKVQADQTGFGATDVALPAAELAKNGLVLFPIAITGISPVVNLPKIEDGQIRLSGAVLARIFMGDISQWNDPAIAQLNPAMSLPSVAVKVVVRSDGSGTTYNFADYLAKISPAWKAKYGVKSSFSWPANFILAKGSDGVVRSVKETSGAISYVDYGYVAQNKLALVQLSNAEGEFVAPSTAGFRAALKNSDWNSKANFSSTLTNMAGKGSWPITMGTFAVVPQVTNNPTQTTAVLQFFIWAFMNGDSLVQQSNFVRLPDRIQSLAYVAISSVTDKSGNKLKLKLM